MEHKLYIKIEKYEFGHQEIMFLGHRISKEKWQMDQKKVQALLDWQAVRSLDHLTLDLILLREENLKEGKEEVRDREFGGGGEREYLNLNFPNDLNSCYNYYLY